jgi:hypothetical protein
MIEVTACALSRQVIKNIHDPPARHELVPAT